MIRDSVLVFADCFYRIIGNIDYFLFLLNSSAEAGVARLFPIRYWLVLKLIKMSRPPKRKTSTNKANKDSLVSSEPED